MLVYLIKELRDLFGFSIKDVILQLNPDRVCTSEIFNDWTYIFSNFPDAKDADEYTKELFSNILNINPTFEDGATHHRWIKFETEAGCVEIRFDHSISGGWKSMKQYRDKDTLDGSVIVTRKDKEILYYMIIKRN
jgi:hypothetical protein